MLSIVGVLVLLGLAIVLIRGKVIPSVALIFFPLLGAIVVGTAFPDLLKYVAKGVIGVLPVVALFVFSITYFGTMSDTGLFDRIISFLVKRIGKSIYSVVCVTYVIACIAHLDGSGVSTLLITVPAMLPVYEALKIRKVVLAIVVSFAIAGMNIVPWGGPTIRAATVIGVDPALLWQKMMLVQVIGLVLAFVVLYFIAKREEKRGEFVHQENMHASIKPLSDKEQALRRPKLWWANFIITVILLASLVIGLPSFVVFMFGCAIILPLNYRSTKEQNGRIKEHAQNIMPVAFTIMGAGALLGILSGTGMVEAMSHSLLLLIPESAKPIMHIILGLLSTPLSFVLDADTLIFGLLPIIVTATSTLGISSIAVASLFVIGHNFGITLCLTNATVYFAIGLFGLEYKEYFKFAVGWTLAFGSIMVLLSAFLVK